MTAKKKETKAAAAPTGAPKAASGPSGGQHNEVTAESMKRRAKAHRKDAAKLRENSEKAAPEFKFAMNIASQVHEQNARILDGEAEEILSHHKKAAKA